MPPAGEKDVRKMLEDVVLAEGTYPVEAFEFVQRGLFFAVNQIHGTESAAGVSRHITGQQLCEGLRDFALAQWGLLARTVLRRWNVTSTLDFGKIVFTLVHHQLLSTTEHDRIEDFRNVFDFKSVFESAYRIPADGILSESRA